MPFSLAKTDGSRLDKVKVLTCKLLKRVRPTFEYKTRMTRLPTQNRVGANFINTQNNDTLVIPNWHFLFRRGHFLWPKQCKIIDPYLVETGLSAPSQELHPHLGFRSWPKALRASGYGPLSNRLVYEGHWVKFKITGATEVKKSLFPQCKTSIVINSGSIKHRAMNFACSIGFTLEMTHLKIFSLLAGLWIQCWPVHNFYNVARYA